MHRLAASITTPLARLLSSAESQHRVARLLSQLSSLLQEIGVQAGPWRGDDGSWASTAGAEIHSALVRRAHCCRQSAKTGRLFLTGKIHFPPDLDLWLLRVVRDSLTHVSMHRFSAFVEKLFFLFPNAGCFHHANTRNSNNRLYPLHVLSREVSSDGIMKLSLARFN